MLLNETPFSDSGTPSAIAPPAEDPTTMKQFTRPRLLDSEAGVCAGMEPPKDLSKFKRGYDDFVHMITAKSEQGPHKEERGVDVFLVISPQAQLAPVSDAPAPTPASAPAPVSTLVSAVVSTFVSAFTSVPAPAPAPQAASAPEPTPVNELEWYIRWSTFQSKPNRNSSRFLRLHKHEGYNHWTNHGVYNTWEDEVSGKEILLGNFKLADRIHWAEIAGSVGVKWPGEDGEWYGPEVWVKNVLAAAVKEGLLEEERRIAVLREAEGV